MFRMFAGKEARNRIGKTVLSRAQPLGLCSEKPALMCPASQVLSVSACAYGALSTSCNNNLHQRETLDTFFFVRDCPTVLTSTIILKESETERKREIFRWKEIRRG